MRRSFLAGATALVLLGGGQVLAQAVSTTIELAPEQRTRIKEYVVREHVRPYVARERLSVGAVLPEDVELGTVPETWGAGVSRYRYVYSGDRVILVEPSTRRVIHVVE
jgi:hypothetical protein